MSNNNNPLAEIAMMVIASLLIIGAVVLLYLGKIDITGATLMFGTAAGIFGVHGALKAPSPSQQQQINDQQASLQQLIGQLTSTILPAVFQAHTHPTPPATPAVQPAPALVQLAPGATGSTTSVQPSLAQSQRVQFVPNPMAAVATQAEIPAIPPQGTQP